MDTLKKKRSVLKGKITRISNILNPKIDVGSIDVAELEVFKEQINEIWSELNSIHNDIMLQCNEVDFETNSNDFDEIAS